MFDIDTSDSQEFERNLEYIIRSMPREARLMMRRMGGKSKSIVKATAKRYVKEKTGNYHKRWKLGRVWMDDEGNYKIRVYNNAPHAHLLEHGHRIVKNGVELGFVEGKKVIDKAQNKLETKWNESLTKELNKIIENI